ncbi:MAG: hypothetical protein AAGA48_01430 [Myxococcota bacterium]
MKAWLVLGLLSVGACGFPSPWKNAEPTGTTIEGWMRTTLDHPHPGAGWFRVDDLEAYDFSQASLKSVRRAKDDVVVLQIGRVDTEGTTVLEFDIALGAWVAGAVPVDGVSAIGELRRPDGTQQFVLGGSLDVRAAGVAEGDLIEVSFVDLTLARVQP